MNKSTEIGNLTALVVGLLTLPLRTLRMVSKAVVLVLIRQLHCMQLHFYGVTRTVPICPKMSLC